MAIEKSLPYDEYAKRPGVNGSLLKIVDSKSLKHAKAYIDGIGDEESDALETGTSFHALLLEGRSDYVIHPATYPHRGDKSRGIAPGDPAPWNSTAAHCKEWIAEQGGKSIYSKAEADDIEAMVESAKSALGISFEGERELSIFAERDGLPVKARLDFLPSDPSAPIIDFKSCLDANPQKFLKQAIDKGYHLSCAWHMDVARLAGIERKEFWLVGIEKKAPFVTCILKFKDVPLSFLRVGRRRARAAFQKLKIAHENNEWPGYGNQFAEDHAMPWMMPELEATA